MATSKLGQISASGAGSLSETQQQLLDHLRRDGIAIVPFDELFNDDRLWARLEADIGDFAGRSAERVPELLARDDDKAYIARRFVARRAGDAKPPKWKFALTDPWLTLGLSNEILGMVNAYRGEQTHLIDLDNWYTIPDPSADERIESQRWHRDPWDNHIVKVFIYFSDVDEQAGPFEYVRGSAAGGRYGDLWPWVPEGVYPPDDEFEAAIPAEDRLTVTGPAGTVIVCDTSGFHRGGAASAKPRVLSYHTYVSAPTRKSRRFKVDWGDGGYALSPAARFAIAWSRKDEKNAGITP
jgi:hypothetical protein